MYQSGEVTLHYIHMSNIYIYGTYTKHVPKFVFTKHYEMWNADNRSIAYITVVQSMMRTM